MTSDSPDDGVTLTFEELQQRYVKRARAIMMDYFAADEKIHLYGLHLQKAQAGSSLWDIVKIDGEGEDQTVRYIDTIDVSKYTSATQLANAIASAYPEDESKADPDDDESTDEPDPTRSFQ